MFCSSSSYDLTAGKSLERKSGKFSLKHVYLFLAIYRHQSKQKEKKSARIVEY